MGGTAGRPRVCTVSGPRSARWLLELELELDLANLHQGLASPRMSRAESSLRSKPSAGLQSPVF